MRTDPPGDALPLGIYRHFKGMEYEVIGVATHSETREEQIVYRARYGGYGLFVRPRAMFVEKVTRDGITQPRFAYVAPSDVHKLAHEAQLAARAFLLTAARPLEAALYAREFEGAADEPAYTALTELLNADGGFGHGLEPDLTTPDSSVLATTTALQTLRHMGAPGDHPLVRGAIGWLNGAYDATNTRWPLIPPTANNAPHAPWWTVGPDHAALFRQYAVNPRAEILGYLYTFAALADAAVVAAVEGALIAHFEDYAEPLDMNEVLCTVRLLESPNVPVPLRAAAHGAILRALPGTLAQNDEAWESYSLQPLQVAARPSALFAPVVTTLLAANLDFRIADQQDDGSWTPMWNWGGLFAHAWPAARVAWLGILTLEALRSLRAFGRFAL